MKMMLMATAVALGAGSIFAQEIGTWSGFRKGAASFTFDDGAPSHVSDVGPAFEKYGYRATFNLVVNWNPNWSGFQQLADKGHDIASHSNSHPQNMSGEEAGSKQQIESKIKQEYGCIIVAYPNCNVPNSSAVLQNYAAGRICNGSWQNVSDIVGKDGPSDWAKIPALMTGSEGNIKSTSDFTGQMQKASQQGGWVQFLTHGLSGKNNGSATYSPTDLGAIEGALQWANQNDGDIWVAPMRDVVMYLKERKASKIEAVSGGAAGALTYKLTHNIADNVSKYNYPLSVRVKSDWSKVSATQDGKAIEATIKDGYIYFEAIPNGGDIVITNGQGGSTPTSSSSVEPSSSASNPATAVKIPGKIEAEEFDASASTDSDDVNEGDAESPNGVDVVYVDENNASAGKAIGYTKVGETLVYNVSVDAAGDFNVDAHVASGSAGSGFTVSFDGANPLTFSVPNTGSWQTYETVTGEAPVKLTAGTHQVKVEITGENVNIDYLEFKLAGSLAIAQNVFLSSKVRSYGVFSITGALVKKISSNVDQSAVEVFNTLQIPQGVYYLKDLKSNQIIKVVK